MAFGNGRFRFDGEEFRREDLRGASARTTARVTGTTRRTPPPSRTTPARSTSTTPTKQTVTPPSRPTPSRPTPSRPTPSRPTPSRPTPSRPTPSRPTPSRPTPTRQTAIPAPSRPVQTPTPTRSTPTRKFSSEQESVLRSQGLTPDPSSQQQIDLLANLLGSGSSQPSGKEIQSSGIKGTPIPPKTGGPSARETARPAGGGTPRRTPPPGRETTQTVTGQQGLTAEELADILEARGFNRGSFDFSQLRDVAGTFQQFETSAGGGTGANAAVPAERPADAIIQNLAQQVADPTAPVEGLFDPTLQQAPSSDELEEEITLNTPQDIQAATVTGPEGTQIPLMEALRVGADTPEVQAQLGTVPPEALVQAAQSAGIPEVEIPNILRNANIDPAVIETLPVVQAAQGTLSSAAQVTAVTGTESPEFRQAVSEEQDRLINFPVDPRATVQEQYSRLMADVSPGATPPWAAAAVRAAEGKLAARGLGASSIAAEGITSALMQAALPIATQDAQVFQTMNLEKFSQTAAIGMLRASHLATLNEQNIANQQQANIVNAQSALQIDLANLDNEQQAAIVNAQNALARATSNAGFSQQAAIEEARQALQIDTANLDANTKAALQTAQSQLTVETANLSARQQAQVENAKAFMNINMANLDNSQQAAIINSQSRLQTLLSDQAATNTARQLNTQNTLEVNKFMTELGQRAKEFNSAQQQDVRKFNQTVKDSREKFNAENALAVQRSNVDYLRRINTANTALENQANLVNSQNLLGISNTAMANLVTLARDREAFTFQASENVAERATRRAIAELASNTNLQLQSNQQQANNSAFLGGLASDIIGGVLGSIF